MKPPNNKITNNKPTCLKFEVCILEFQSGGLAQLARALDLHSRGQGFDSPILHKKMVIATSIWIIINYQ